MRTNLYEPQQSKFFGLYEKYPPMNRVIASADLSELCYSPKPDWDMDPRFFFFNETRFSFDHPVRAVIGQTGIVENVSMRKGRHVVPLLSRLNAFGNYQTHDTYMTVDEILAAVYEEIEEMSFHEPYFTKFFNWNEQRVIARFKKFGLLYSDRDIVPEFNDTMMIVKISEGCPRKCIYCPEPATNVALYDFERVRQNIRNAKSIVTEFHADHLHDMTELFINGSDLLWSRVLSGKVDLNIVGEYLGDKIGKQHMTNGKFRNAIDPVRIVDMCRQEFPWVEKIYGFAGVPTVLATNADDKSYLRRLYADGDGINRWLIGIESFHEEVSRFLGKKETAQDKINAIRILQETGAKVKPIIQVGMIGEGIDIGGRFISSWEDIGVTVNMLLSTVRKRDNSNRDVDKVIVSEYLDVPGTPLAAMHASGRVVKASPGMIQSQMKWIERTLLRANIAVDMNYQPALEGRQRINDKIVSRSKPILDSNNENCFHRCSSYPHTEVWGTEK